MRSAEGDPRAGAYEKIGEAYMKLGLYGQAIESFTKAFAIDPKSGAVTDKERAEELLRSGETLHEFLHQRGFTVVYTRIQSSHK